MNGPALSRLAAFTLAGVVCASAASAQSSTGSSTKPPQTPAQAPSVPPNVDRIREAVNTPPTLIITDGQLRIYVEVIGNWPTFFEYTKGTDFLKGPAGGRGAITHNELLGSLTPKELYGSGGISAGELLQGAVVNWLGQLVIKKGLKEISEARSSDEIARIRARIDRELEALKGGR
jgi:hypothetical protein